MQVLHTRTNIICISPNTYFSSCIKNIFQTAGNIGFDKVRITGGEPLLRTNVIDIVNDIRECGYFNTIAMTTNGSLLTREMAERLNNAGLTHITISLDILDPEEFKHITGVDAISHRRRIWF